MGLIYLYIFLIHKFQVSTVQAYIHTLVIAVTTQGDYEHV